MRRIVAEEIENFCRLNYGVTFPMMAKVHTKGEAQAPVYRTLTAESGEEFRGEIRWNFTKFLIDREGKPQKRFASRIKPNSLVDDIVRLLGQTVPESGYERQAGGNNFFSFL